MKRGSALNKDKFLTIDFKGAIFDLDGTLLDSMWVWNRVDETFLGKRGFDVPPDYLEHIAAAGFRKAAEYTKERFGLKEDIEEIMAEWNMLAHEAYATKVGLTKGVVPYLTMLKEKGVRMVVATANHESLFMPALKNNRLDGFFESYCTVLDVGVDKTSPAIYLEAAGRLGIPKDEIVVFEDNNIAVRTSVNAGFFTVAVEDESNRDSFDEIRETADLFYKGFEEIIGIHGVTG